MKNFFRLAPLGFLSGLACLVLATACMGLNDPPLLLGQVGNDPTPLGACLSHHYLIGGLASDGGDGRGLSRSPVTLPQCSVTPTPTVTGTVTSTKTATATQSATTTPTRVGTSTTTPTGTVSATATSTSTRTPTVTQTPTATSTGTQVPTATPTPTQTSTPTPTQVTSTPTQTPTPTPTTVSCAETPGLGLIQTGGVPPPGYPSVKSFEISPYDIFCPGDTITYQITIDSPTPVTSVTIQINMDHTAAGGVLSVPSCSADTECTWSYTFTARSTSDCTRDCGLPGQMLTAPDTNSVYYVVDWTITNSATTYNFGYPRRGE